MNGKTESVEQQTKIERYHQLISIAPKEKKRRHRARTKGLRAELATLIENLLLDSRSNISTVAFRQLRQGNLGTPFSAVLSQLQRNGQDISRFASLSRIALKSIGNLTQVFTITEMEGAEDLWIQINPRFFLNRDEKTVYVDDLPPMCTEEKLTRRASFFGRVVSIHMPQIIRIQRRIAQILGGVKPAHSGFAFVQFASKTAAKRFCKRYALNSRLKRIHHHHHGHRHSKKKVMAKTATGTDGQSQQIAPSGQTSASCFPATSMSTSIFDAVSVFDVENEGEGGGIRLHHSAEESAMSESGNETDTNIGGKATIMDHSLMTEQITVCAKHKRRRTRRQTTKPQVGQSLNALFRHIQVFPLKQYRELRADYLRMRKARMEVLKKQLSGMKSRMQQQETGEQPEMKKIGTEGSEDGKSKNRRKLKKPTRRRGIRRLMQQAERTKAEASAAREHGCE